MGTTLIQVWIYYNIEFTKGNSRTQELSLAYPRGDVSIGSLADNKMILP